MPRKAAVRGEKCLNIYYIITLLLITVTASSTSADWDWKNNKGTVYQGSLIDLSFFDSSSPNNCCLSPLNVLQFDNYVFSGGSADAVIKVSVDCSRVEIDQSYIKDIKFENGKMVVEIDVDKIKFIPTPQKGDK